MRWNLVLFLDNLSKISLVILSYFQTTSPLIKFYINDSKAKQVTSRRHSQPQAFSRLDRFFYFFTFGFRGKPNRLFMEVISIEIDLLDSLVEDLQELANQTEEICVAEDYNSQQWLDTQDVCRILNVCYRTLQSLRDNGKLSFTQIERKFYYKPDDVENLLKSLQHNKQ